MHLPYSPGNDAGPQQQAQLTVSCCMQFAFNTLSRVSPVSHGVCNVVCIASLTLPSFAFLRLEKRCTVRSGPL